MYPVGTFISSHRTTRLALLTVVLVAASMHAGAADWTPFTTNVTMPSGRTFQVPLTASDPQGAPLTFSVVSISDTNVTGVISSTNNRSLLFNVSGVDATNGPFTGDIVLHLYEDLVPLTTDRIIQLAENGFYNGLIFHRVIQNFVAQGGDPLGTGTGGSGIEFDDEYVTNLTFTGFGQLAMANSGDDSNDSQFFITDVDLSLSNPSQPPSHLNFNHTIFGQLARGFDVMMKILATPVGANDRPLTNVVINSATIFTNTQEAVLHLSAAAGFTGTADVTVSATDTNNVSADQTIRVTVIANTANSAAFLGPVPTDLVTTQSQAITFPLTVTDIDGDPVTVTVVDPNTGQFPINLLSATYTNIGQLTIVPSMTFTGVLDLVVRAKDPAHDNDSQHFSLTVQGCDYSLNAAGDSFPQTGGTGVVSVTVVGGCPWFTTTTNSWIGITDGTGTGSDTVSFIVTTNTTGVTRVGKLTIAGLTYTITQDGLGCSYELNSSGTNHTSVAGIGAFNVTTLVGCPWTAVTTDTWIQTTSSGTGSGTINYTVTTNLDSVARIGTITVEGEVFTVTQDPPCGFQLSTNAISVGADATNSTVDVTAFSNCNWTATSNDSWITIDSGTNGTGNGSVAFSIDANPALTQRTGSMLIAGIAFTVTQASNTVNFSQITGDWDVTIASSLKVSKVVDAERSSDGNDLLFPDGTFELMEQEYGSTPIASGSYLPDAKGKKVEWTVSPTGQEQLRQFLLTWLAEAAVANGVTLTGEDLSIDKLKIGKTKIDDTGLLGPTKISVSGQFTGTVNGTAQTGKFSSKLTVTFIQKNSL